MIKVSIFRYLFFFLTYLLITPYLSAQTDTLPDIINNGKILDLEEEDKIIIVDDNCMVSFMAQVKVVNNEPANFQNNSYEDMYLRYTVNQVTEFIEIPPLNQFSASTGGIVWFWEHEITVPVYADCQEGFQSVTVELELVTLENSEYVMYPVDNYGDPFGIFSCDHFDATCELCPMPPATCVPDDYRGVIYEESFALNCDLCDEEVLNSFYEKNENAFSRSAKPEGVNAYQISPNPFQNSLQFFTNKSTEVAQNFRIFSASGQILFTGSENSLISTEDWSPGIYFIEVITDGKRDVERLIKLD